MVKIGILVLSDRASSGIYEDKSGIEIEKILNDYIQNEKKFYYELIPDEYDLIVEKLIYLADEIKCDLIFTTGGTGPALRDVTPEATEVVCDKILPGFGELMRLKSLEYVPTAILSRQSAGIRKKSLIINLPGNPKAIKECIDPIFPAIPYCVDLIGGSYIKNNEDKISVFRPKNKS
ncbi:molybdopterin adenylyltransferase [Campylobacter insulaenigrae]|uniref:Molybdopterin adenylyltransferase n=2 Tax=Campylobacter insulaenigrae TaxID=260714 RepID=A0A0A8H1V1_9BACT|nr:molybdopterin adenylyltransferase [Campylobacter insulaenigrae]AJC87650.1 molybdopterin adenylyltransferase [Campylobacter insulaenigrae NCTC 12927]MCR6570153.1 molybdopterin adenylyltransferase [Campylobacter insulaenigrae]MCR6571938.1 molybdopterin adenylyltransferase [Campylobacter insulaenigrae]MCR6573196.1 molybdopterin adenylyltransferase [Campylobacter insulaenigrae]MCR6574983.1 molybdopterin adenylyltransferase [Campylobacter insulaenigrae]